MKETEKMVSSFRASSGAMENHIVHALMTRPSIPYSFWGIFPLLIPERIILSEKIGCFGVKLYSVGLADAKFTPGWKAGSKEIVDHRPNPISRRPPALQILYHISKTGHVTVTTVYWPFLYRCHRPHIPYGDKIEEGRESSRLVYLLLQEKRSSGMTSSLTSSTVLLKEPVISFRSPTSLLEIRESNKLQWKRLSMLVSLRTHITLIDEHAEKRI